MRSRTHQHHTIGAPIFFRCLRISLRLLLLISLSLLAAPLRAEVNRHQILLLHSYHEPMTWVHDITQAVQDELISRDESAVLHIEYLDTKRFSDQAYLDRLADLYAHKYADTRFELILSADNHAFEFLKQHRNRLFGEVPTIFCGVNNFHDEWLEGFSKVTGVTEHISPRETIEVALRLHPETKRVVIINDYLKTGRAWEHTIREEVNNAFPGLEFIYNQNESITELTRRLAQLAPSTIVLLGVYFADNEGMYFTYETIGKRIAEASPVPVYALLEQNIGPGVIGGKVIRAYNQGQMMAKIAWQIHQGESPEAIAVVRKGSNPFLFNYPELAKHHLNKADLPDGSIILNKPNTFYDRNKPFIWMTFAFIFILLSINAFLWQNIKRKKRLEKDLLESKERFRIIFERASVGITLVNPDGNFLRANAKYCELTGYSSEELASMHINDLTHPDDRETSIENFGKLMLEAHYHYNQEKRYLTKDGKTIWVLVNASKYIDADNTPYIIGIIEDINQRKIAEEELKHYQANLEVLVEQRAEQLIAANKKLKAEITERERIEHNLQKSEKRFREISELMPQIIFECDQFSRITFINETGKHILNELPGAGARPPILTDLFPSEKQADINQLSQKILSGELTTLESESSMLAGNGRTFPCLIYVQPIREDEKIIGLRGLLVDITSRKTIEDQLNQASRQFTTILDSIDAIVYVADMQSHEIIFINSYVRKLFGDVEGKICWQTLQTDQTGPCEFCTNAYLVDDFGRPAPPYVWEHRNTLTGRWYHIIDRAIQWIDGRIVRLEIATDISQKKHLEEELLRTKKLEATATLAGGIAHDFNNLLTAVIGNIELAQIASMDKRKTKNLLDQALDATWRATELTNKFITLSAGGTPIKELISLPKLIEANTNLALSGSNIVVEYNLPEDLWKIQGDENQLRQVILNVVQNARESMPDGGTIRVAGENVPQEELPMEFENTHNAPSFVLLTISDEGQGIHKDHITKIFDPYFSTKSRGAQKGMGLGLTVVYSVVKKHGGDIFIDSAAKAGTRVKIYLPAQTGEKAVSREATAVKAEITESSLQNKKILVMDDEYLIRDIAKTMLTHLGCRVDVASHGDEALSLYKNAQREERPYDAVILDLTIKGGLGGQETIKGLKLMNPEVKALVCSGYTDDPVIQNFSLFGFAGKLPKPYNKAELQEALSTLFS